MKIVVLGAGSVVFGPPLLHDLIYQSSRSPDVLALVDVNEEALDLVQRAAERLVDFWGKNTNLEATTDRREALVGADFVVIAAERDRIDRWKADCRILERFGIPYTLGENRGPAGVSHTLRTVPLVLSMCQDVNKIAPNAFALIMTNPEDRVTYAVKKYTGLEVAGYCDGPWDFRDRYLGKLLGLPGEAIYAEGAGINHAVWLWAIRERATNRDLYPEMLKRAKEENWQPLGQHLYKLYGLWPHENDEHYGEYIRYACELIDCRGYDFERHAIREQGWKRQLAELATGAYSAESFAQDLREFSWYIFGDMPPSRVLKGLYMGEPTFLQGINIENEGKIPKLPDDMIVEVPAIATPSGIKGIKMPPFADPLTSFLSREGAIQKLSAEAAAEGSREKALAALILDPQVESPDLAGRLLTAFEEEHRGYFPELS